MWSWLRSGYRKGMWQMADHDRDSSNEEKYGSVYDYIEANYKEEWSKLDAKSGILVDWGLVAANRWEQFESTYRSNYADCSADYMSDAEFQSRMTRKYQEMAEYYEIHDTPAEERIDVFTNTAVQEEIWAEMKSDAEAKASDSAALAAFETIGEGVLQMDHEKRLEESEAAVKASTESKNRQINRELEEALQKNAEKNPEYLVRGAPLRCRFGSHMRYLDLLEAHGVYLKKSPVMHRTDCVVGENIMPFGICSSPVHKLETRGSLFAGAETDQKGNYLQAPDDRVITGFLCDPDITGRSWKNFKEETMIAQNATSETESPDGCECYEALTTASYLVCSHGGIIFPLESGQLKFSTYSAPFQNYPFAVLKAENNELSEEEQKAFEKWCEQHGICPVSPGTEEYMKWYEDKINGLIEDNASEKKIRAAYEECLDNAYWYGLDRMNEKAQDAVRDMVTRYEESGYLSSEESAEMDKKYSGLRLDYGYNTQKNLAGATPEEDGFYQYYTKRAREFELEQEELTAQMRQAGYMEDSNAVLAVANIIRDLQKEKEQTYGYFQREAERYSDYLDEERKGQVQDVDSLFSKKE